MKLCQVILLTALRVMVSVFSACGPSEAENAHQRAYDQALRGYQERILRRCYELPGSHTVHGHL